MRQATGSRTIHGTTVHGVDVDGATRCAHYHGPTDVVALRFYCCGRWYPCYQCHAAYAGHPPAVWPLDQRDARAVLCGVCGAELTIEGYLQSGSRCPKCAAAFNPACAGHYHLYFEMTADG